MNAQTILNNKLLLAAGKYTPDKCKMLLDEGADAKANNSEVLINVFKNAKCRQMPLFVLFLEAGARADACDSRALIVAAQMCNAKLCALLLNAGARADARDSQALIEVVTADSTVQMKMKLTKLLIRHGARSDAQNSRVLAIAAHHGPSLYRLLRMHHGVRFYDKISYDNCRIVSSGVIEPISGKPYYILGE